MMYDFCVVGGGIVGLATCHSLLKRFPGAKLVLIEKEGRFGTHQTGHNSGVIHAGIYYQPKSLKAELCKSGSRATQDFCDEHAIPYEIRGKLVVAVDDEEVTRLKALQQNADINGIEVEELDSAELQAREPAVRGKAALLVKASGIVDYTRICDALGAQIGRHGFDLFMNTPVGGLSEADGRVTITTPDRQFTARHAIICAGLQADRLVQMSGLKADFRIIPFRGEYYATHERLRNTFSHLIYPVPEPGLPFLGVHFTPTMRGSLIVGPNAVLGFAREGYQKFSLNGRDLMANLSFPGLWRLGLKHWRFAVEEFRDSIIKKAYLAKCRKYWPDLGEDDLLPSSAGIRAQAVTRSGELIHDFLFMQSDRVLHVCNAPSPAATSALPIGEMIAQRVESMRANTN